MDTQKSIEERLASLESAVQELQNRVRNPTPGRNWWEAIEPISDREAFEKMIEFGRVFRQTGRLPDDPGESV